MTLSWLLPSFWPVTLSRNGEKGDLTMKIRKASLWTLATLALVQAVSAAELGSGIASYYGHEFAGKRTASGEVFNPASLTAAHRYAAFGSRIRVTNIANGRDVIVRVNDRGPWTGGRIIDVSHAAAKQLGMLGSGTARVKLSAL
jgi:rare lipoprotein A